MTKFTKNTHIVCIKNCRYLHTWDETSKEYAWQKADDNYEKTYKWDKIIPYKY